MNAGPERGATSHGHHHRMKKTPIKYDIHYKTKASKVSRAVNYTLFIWKSLKINLKANEWGGEDRGGTEEWGEFVRRQKKKERIICAFLVLVFNSEAHRLFFCFNSLNDRNPADMCAHVRHSFMWKMSFIDISHFFIGLTTFRNGKWKSLTEMYGWWSDHLECDRWLLSVDQKDALQCDGRDVDFVNMWRWRLTELPQRFLIN